MAHLQRKFEEAIPNGTDVKSSKVTIGYDYCNRLFSMEKKCVDLSAEKRYEELLNDVKPFLDEFWQWVPILNPLQYSNLGKAVTNALNQKVPLNNFLLDERIELSNNRVENAIRPYVTDKKNWLLQTQTVGLSLSNILYAALASFQVPHAWQIDFSGALDNAVTTFIALLTIHPKDKHIRMLSDQETNMVFDQFNLKTKLGLRNYII